jgi:hypothetical protein
VAVGRDLNLQQKSLLHLWCWTPFLLFWICRQVVSIEWSHLQQCNLQRGVRSPTWRLSSQWCLCRIWSLYHRDLGVSWQLLSKPHVLHHTISLTTWNGFAAHYFIRTKLFWNRKFAIIKNRTKNFTCFFFFGDFFLGDLKLFDGDFFLTLGGDMMNNFPE